RTETNAVLSTSGALVETAQDSWMWLVFQPVVARANGYGKFSIGAGGAWTYTTNTAHNEFVAGTDYTDSITVATADGTAQVVTVTITGTDDRTVITGVSTQSLDRKSVV